MSKAVIFWPYIPKFFCRPIFFPNIPNKASPAYYFFTFLDLKNDFLDFIDLKKILKPF